MHKNCNLLVMRENSEDALWMPMWRWINNGSLLQEQCRAARRHCFESTGSLNGFCHRPSLSVGCEWEAVLIWGGGGDTKGDTLIISNKATIPKVLPTTLVDSYWLSSSHFFNHKLWLNLLSKTTILSYVRNSLILTSEHIIYRWGHYNAGSTTLFPCFYIKCHRLYFKSNANNNSLASLLCF